MWGNSIKRVIGGQKGAIAYICEGLPVVLDLSGGIPPLLANDLGDLGIGEARILGDDCGLVVLAVQDESYTRYVSQQSTLFPQTFKQYKTQSEWITAVNVYV